MSNIIEYKGYIGSVEYSADDGVFCGKLLGIDALVMYDGTNVDELISDFHTAVDDYLIFCEQDGREPAKPNTALLDVELDKNLYEKLERYISDHKVTLEHAVEFAIGQLVAAN